MNAKIEFATLLWAARTLRGLTQREAASELRVTTRSLGRWERDIFEPAAERRETLFPLVVNWIEETRNGGKKVAD